MIGYMNLYYKNTLLNISRLKMRIEEDIKLDFKDVLIRPKRSTLGSRKDVELKRYFRFKHSRDEYDGIPIMAANMTVLVPLKWPRPYRNTICLLV